MNYIEDDKISLYERRKRNIEAERRAVRKLSAGDLINAARKNKYAREEAKKRAKEGIENTRKFVKKIKVKSPEKFASPKLWETDKKKLVKSASNVFRIG